MAYASVRKDSRVLRQHNSLIVVSAGDVCTIMVFTQVYSVHLRPLLRSNCNNLPEEVYPQEVFLTPSSCSLVRYSCYYDTTRLIKERDKRSHFRELFIYFLHSTLIDAYVSFLLLLKKQKRTMPKKSIIAKDFVALCKSAFLCLYLNILSLFTIMC